MTQREKFQLLAACYRSDLERLEAIKEAAWFFAQLPEIPAGDPIAEAIHCQAVMDGCDQERLRTRRNLADLESLLADMGSQ